VARRSDRARRASGLDWFSAARRLEAIIDCLTTRAVSRTVSVDHRTAMSVIEYCRQRAQGAKFDAQREQELTNFISDHNQSFDWVILGDATDMICQLAEGTRSTRRPQLRIVN
jgi:hypothetical protein